MLNYQVWKIKDHFWNDTFLATISNVRLASFKEELTERQLSLINLVATTPDRNEALQLSEHIEF